MAPKYLAVVWALLVVSVAGCHSRPDVPYFTPPRAQDAATEIDVPGSAVRDAAVGDAPPVLTTPVEPASAHTGSGCGDFSTGVVHGEVYTGTPIGVLLTELSLDGTAHEGCGAFRAGKEFASSMTIRPSDGKLLYLRDGFIYQYVPDVLDAATEAGANGDVGGLSPFDNDIKQTVANKCPPNPDPDRGPFSWFMLKPNGGLVYDCVADNEDTLYNEKGEAIGPSGWVAAIDDEDKILNQTPVPIQSSRFELIWDHGATLSLKVVGDSDHCFADSKYIAVRALDRGFLLVLSNRCGAQLWRSDDKELTLLSHYVYHPLTQEQRDHGAHLELAFDNALYFMKALCQPWEFCLRCKGTYCAIKPGERTATPTIYEVLTVPSEVADYDHSFLATWHGQ
jgi:hypothetical protein